jgi:hypothetical protein
MSHTETKPTNKPIYLPPSTTPPNPTKMKKRRLGASNLEVSAIGLGCMSMTGAYGSVVDRQDMISLLRTAVERGVEAPRCLVWVTVKRNSRLQKSFEQKTAKVSKKILGTSPL